MWIILKPVLHSRHISSAYRLLGLALAANRGAIRWQEIFLDTAAIVYVRHAETSPKLQTRVYSSVGSSGDEKSRRITMCYLLISEFIRLGNIRHGKPLSIK